MNQAISVLSSQPASFGSGKRELPAKFKGAMSRHSISDFIERISPLVSRAKDRVRRVRNLLLFSIGNKKCKLYVYEKRKALA